MRHDMMLVLTKLRTIPKIPLLGAKNNPKPGSAANEVTREESGRL
jgi:hypothetical protein